MSQESDRLNKIIIEQIQPLYETWCVEANLDETERALLYDKLFNPDTPNEQDIADKMCYSVRTIRRMWRKVRNKIYKTLP